MASANGITARAPRSAPARWAEAAAATACSHPPRIGHLGHPRPMTDDDRAEPAHDESKGPARPGQSFERMPPIK
jgi:hypothetical protein